MPLTTGTRLGPYEIIAAIGAGGMGEVYRAREANLNRDVAIKVLPDTFARDVERVARFRREAQALAALNDPHIAQIYRLEEIEGSVALVMELVEGEDLSEIIARQRHSAPAAAGPSESAPAAGVGVGPHANQGMTRGTAASGGGAPRALEIDAALRIARQIAAGLEVAHEKGIVHRDLKPANVKVTPEGQVKILDFGLAKAMAGDPASSDLANSPTLTAAAFAQGYGGPGTQMGMILGTAAYMSPEQARGKAVDKRADIWAFGAVLFEMLTGRRAFDGDTVSDVLAAVLKTEPDWTALPAATPAHVTALLRRCLDRDLSRRLRDIGEARFAFDTGQAPAGASAMTSGIVAGTPAPAPRSHPWMWIAASAMFALIALYFAARATIWNKPGAAPAGSFDLALAAPDGAEFQIGTNSGNVIVSPDGTKIAFVAATPKTTTLWVRSLTADDAHSIAGTEGAFYPFWSPDGRRIAFFAGSKLKTVDLAGGLPEAIADAPVGRGGSWAEDGTIIFTPSGAKPISRVASTGGPVTPLTTLDTARQENAHYGPVFLPGGSQFLYFARSAQPENSGIYLARLDGSVPPIKLVASLGSGLPVIRPSTGELYLVWARESDLLAERLDAAAGVLRGDAVTIAHGVRVDDSQRLTFTGASRTGVLAWATQHAADVVLGVYNRAGRRVQQVDARPLQPLQPALSPDGRMVAFMSADKGGSDIYMRDLQTGDTQRVTTEVPYDEEPSWTPDGRSILHGRSLFTAFDSP